MLGRCGARTDATVADRYPDQPDPANRLWDNRGVDDLQRLMAKDAIADLVLRYSEAIANRDVDEMVTLFADDAEFGRAGTGPAALRTLMTETMGDLIFGVILVANHRIHLDTASEATGEVWARCYAQNPREGYYEQLVKYLDKYRLVTSPSVGDPGWRFVHRRHLLWFGQSAENPLRQPPAHWPANNVGVGRIPLGDPVVQAWRADEGLSH